VCARAQLAAFLKNNVASVSLVGAAGMMVGIAALVVRKNRAQSGYVEMETVRISATHMWHFSFSGAHCSICGAPPRLVTSV
jgi:hypothetical protein